MGQFNEGLYDIIIAADEVSLQNPQATKQQPAKGKKYASNLNVSLDSHVRDLWLRFAIFCNLTILMEILSCVRFASAICGRNLRLRYFVEGMQKIAFGCDFCIGNSLQSQNKYKMTALALKIAHKIAYMRAQKSQIAIANRSRKSQIAGMRA